MNASQTSDWRSVLLYGHDGRLNLDVGEGEAEGGDPVALPDFEHELVLGVLVDEEARREREHIAVVCKAT